MTVYDLSTAPVIQNVAEGDKIPLFRNTEFYSLDIATWFLPMADSATFNALSNVDTGGGSGASLWANGGFLSIPGSSITSSKFYSDDSVKLVKIPDRLFIGSAVDNKATKANPSTGTDWLTSAMAATSIGGWPVYGATTASLARKGNIGLLGASHTSDIAENKSELGYIPSSIGVAAWGIADDTTNPTTATTYAYYGECWRMSGVNYQPSFGMELECVNFGGIPTGLSTPFHVNNGGGTYAIQLGAGGGQTSGTSDAEAGITFVNNPNSFRTGIIFGAGSLTGDDNGSGSGAGVAVNMAPGHLIEWCTPETVSNVEGANTGFSIQSQVTESTEGMRVIAQNGSVSLTNNEGKAVFSIDTNASPDNTITIEAGTGSQAPGIYANGTGTGNLGLFPASGGEIITTGPVTAGNTIPGEVTTYLHINVNGTDYRLPLFTPDQVGG